VPYRVDHLHAVGGVVSPSRPIRGVRRVPPDGGGCVWCSGMASGGLVCDHQQAGGVVLPACTGGLWVQGFRPGTVVITGADPNPGRKIVALRLLRSTWAGFTSGGSPLHRPREEACEAIRVFQALAGRSMSRPTPGVPRPQSLSIFPSRRPGCGGRVPPFREGRQRSTVRWRGAMGPMILLGRESTTCHR
jgi:hypothetical protein